MTAVPTRMILSLCWRVVFIVWKNAFHQKVSEAIAGRLGTINEVILNADIPLICDDVKQIIRYLVRTNRSSGFGGCNEVEECLTCRKDLIKGQIMRCDWCVWCVIGIFIFFLSFHIVIPNHSHYMRPCFFSAQLQSCNILLSKMSVRRLVQ